MAPAVGLAPPPGEAAEDAAPAGAALPAKRKPNAFDDSAEAWRENLRGDAIFVTSVDGRRPDWFWTGVSPEAADAPGVLPDGTVTALPLPDLSRCTRQSVLDYFNNCWLRTEVLFSGLQGEEPFYRPPYHNLRHPLIFYYGHPAALYINKLRVAGVIAEPVNPYFENIFETGVDEMSWDDLSKNDMMWPSLREVTEYRRTVYNIVRDVILKHPCLDRLPITWDSPGWALFMGFEHEGIHLETSSVLFRELPAHCLKKPIWWPAYHPSTTPKDAAAAAAHPANEMLAVEAGDVTLGKPLDFPSFGWDNEYGMRQFHVRSFRASKFCITNGQFLEFVKAGGYRTKDHWTEEGWKWRTFRNAKKPTFWEWDGPQGLFNFKLRLIFEVVDLPLSLPVVVNVHEARAFCQWLSGQHGVSGKATYRLLTEPEHHRLRDKGALNANGQPTTDPVMLKSGSEMRGAQNSNLAWGAEAAVDACAANSGGFHDVHGNVWQWCEDNFAALPNSHGVSILYDDFSTPCYDGEHNIIMGGSFISTGDEASVFARYHFRPHFFQHAGFRIVSSEGPLQTSCMDSPGPHVNNWNPSTTKRHTTSQEVEEALGSQLLLHYGVKQQAFGQLSGGIPDSMCNFTAQLAQMLAKHCQTLGVSTARCLDVGCSVGGCTFQLAKIFNEVTGIDLDAASIRAAKAMKAEGEVPIKLKEEGLLGCERHIACSVGKEQRDSVAFRHMDPCCIAPDMVNYDAVVMVNLLERTASPKAPLGRLVGQAPMVKMGGLLLVASTFNWQESVADRKLWLGGYEDPATGKPVDSAEGVQAFLAPRYKVVETLDVPYFVRKSSRVFEMCVSHVAVFQRVV